MHWLLLVFGLSGAAGLLYEIAALKALTQVFGAMADAAATVLATYMAGLSLGAFLGGRVADKVKRPLVVYAIAEGLIAALVLLLPAGRDLVQSAYIAAARSGFGDAAWLKVALSSLLLLPPTLAMGATLPLLVSGWMRVDPNASRAVPRLYGANTLGAAVGVLAGTYVVLPLLGISKTLVLVAAMDAAAAVAAVGLSRRALTGASALATQAVAGPSLSIRTRPFVAGAAADRPQPQHAPLSLRSRAEADTAAGHPVQGAMDRPGAPDHPARGEEGAAGRGARLLGHETTPPSC